MLQNERLSQKLNKRRQLLLVLPLLILPFMTLAFWALGGGQADAASKPDTPAGINSVVPKAKISASPQDKMSLYAEAERQAQARKEAERATLGQFSYPDDRTGEKNHLYDSLKPDEDAYEQAYSGSKKVEQKLADLQAILEKEHARSNKAGAYLAPAIDPATYGLQPGEQSQEQLDQLGHLNELIARSAGSADAGGENEDKGLSQINTMLDKILAIQHPGQTGAALKAPSGKNKGRIYSVRHPRDDIQVPLLLPVLSAEKLRQFRGESIEVTATADSMGNLTANGSGNGSDAGNSGNHPASYNINDNGRYIARYGGAFYDIDPGKTGAGNEASHYGVYTVPAVISETQTLVSGGAVKMRLTADVFINGTLIQKGNFVYGTCTVNGERLKVRVENIQYQNQLYPVHLTVYDLDGMEGVRIPGAISRDASKQGADRAIQRVQMMSLDPSLTAQAATAGIEAAKGLIRKKVKLVRVTVKAGYPVLLLDGEGHQQGAE